MLYYQFTGEIKGADAANDMASRQERRSNAVGIRERSERYSSGLGEDSRFFVSNIYEDLLTCGAISREKLDIHALAEGFFSAIGLDAELESFGEVTFRRMLDMLESADRGGYITDPSDELSPFGINDIDGHDFRRMMLNEGLIDTEIKREELYAISCSELTEDTLIPELDRIFSCEAKGGNYGHPVHYLIETDSGDSANRMRDTLLGALYDAGRLESRRYFEVNSDFSGRITDENVKSIFEAASGGVFVISLIDEYNNNEDILESFDKSVLDPFCREAHKYSNRVLFVLRLPRECTEIKKRIAEYMGVLTFVELKEDNVGFEKASSKLEMKAKEAGVEADEILFSNLDAAKTYTGAELSKIFERWYNLKLRTAIYPQYSCFSEYGFKQEREKQNGKAYDELASMIGLHEAKAIIDKALNFYKLQRMYKDRGIDQARPAMHMVFTGNPGTAKTTVARLFARIMRENELLSRGHLVEVGRGDLVGKFVGWTAKTVEAKFREADGGVLFIDEAYSLVDDRDGSFGDEAINTIVQQMENRRDSMVVIFAGYPDKMEAFLDKNPGLRSRIAFHVPFGDYSAAELCEIAKHIGRGRGLKLSDGAIEKLERVFEAARHSPDFGNGRYVRNLLEKTEMNMAGRLLSIETDAMTAETLTTIMPEDIEQPAEKPERPERRIGFGA